MILFSILANREFLGTQISCNFVLTGHSPLICPQIQFPFVVGPSSPDALQAQADAEERLKNVLKEAPRALGALLSTNADEVLKGSKKLKLHMPRGLRPCSRELWVDCGYG